MGLPGPLRFFFSLVLATFWRRLISWSAGSSALCRPSLAHQWRLLAGEVYMRTGCGRLSTVGGCRLCEARHYRPVPPTPPAYTSLGGGTFCIT